MVLSAGFWRSWNAPFLLIQNLTTGVTLSVSTVTLVILYSNTSRPVGRVRLLGVRFSVRWTKEGCKEAVPWQKETAHPESSGWAKLAALCPSPFPKLTFIY